MIREPAVAGAFYPLSKAELQKKINNFLSNAKVEKIHARAGIVPHAGYAYSGQTAAYFYKTIESQSYDNVVILGPNHSGEGAEISIFPDGAFSTPLGDVEINDKLASKIYGTADRIAHMPEHSIEVQLPFLQTVLKDFKIVPVCIQNQSKGEMIKLGNSLKKSLGKNDLVIASSDFSHYVSQETALENDHKLINSILKFDIEKFYKNIMEDESACGFGGIAAAMGYAKESKSKLLKYDTSGTASGDFSQVVGYASIVFY